MEESVLVIKAEKYLKEISNDDIRVEDIDEFDNFKYLYFKLADRLEKLKQLRRDMEVQGYSTPFASLNKYGNKSIGEVSLEEVSENSRHNQMFRNKANAKKNILDRVKSAIDSHQIALGHLEQYGYLKCDSCYKKYSISEYIAIKGKCKCRSESFSFKISRENTYRVEIIPYLPLSGNYRVLMADLSRYGRNAFKKVINALKQERTGHVKTISPLFRYKDKNNRWLRKRVTFDSEFVDNYEEELRKTYGKYVRIEKLEFHRTKPAIIDDKHARTAIALGYVRYAESIIDSIRDDIFKRQLTDFKRINNYDLIIHKYSNYTPNFIDEFDVAEIENWRENKIKEEFSKFHYLDRYGELNRSLKRDLKTRETIERTIFEDIAPALISWDIFRYYLTTSVSNRKISTGPFPYIRVELDRQQRRVFQKTFSGVIDILNQFSDIRILEVPDKDLILYEKFKFEKLMKSSNIKVNHPALGAAHLYLNSDIDLELISNSFYINESKIRKEIKHIENIKNPKTDKSKKFLDLIKG
ncbi:DUF530 domain-containing protein [Methanobrevibacter millerae]|uniref:Uncharacterized protein n=1 Tax=Methanobrevibacter millerae TaxID=230361 RepID=A0A1G5XKU8_9EURY|nr:DUF530 domain-containing protein [Methanobrevibacter millerae]SDA70564.1 hypothetical protein SAMN02910315_02316 [Methanobrevibacter millerae]